LKQYYFPPALAPLKITLAESGPVLPYPLQQQAFKKDAFAKTYRIAKQKLRPKMLGVFSGIPGIDLVCRGPEKTP
jgi:hypothetical protein